MSCGKMSTARTITMNKFHTLQLQFKERMRKCKHRRKIISYVDDPAGLSYRKVVLQDLSQLAGYLCAKLVSRPPPSAHLNSDHNNGVPIKDTSHGQILTISPFQTIIRQPFDSWTTIRQNM